MALLGHLAGKTIGPKTASKSYFILVNGTRLRASGPTGGRPGTLFRFRTRSLEVTDQFAVLRPPGPARASVA